MNTSQVPLGPDQLKLNAAAMTALADGKPIEAFWNGGWQSYNRIPNDWHLHEYRPKPEAVTRPWSKPDDVPGPVCWIRGKASLGIQMMVIAIWEQGVGFRDSGQRYPHKEWSQLSDWEHSTDRINWKPCTVEVAP